MSHLTGSGDLGFAGPGVWHLEPLLHFITEKSPMGSSYHYGFIPLLETAYLPGPGSQDNLGTKPAMCSLDETKNLCPRPAPPLSRFSAREEHALHLQGMRRERVGRAERVEGRDGDRRGGVGRDGKGRVK